ncbi:hypothetical protein IFM89_010663 [Coptis chinensis]|uniref:Uncharacterized protein n=1 Tax=Coptis chinensis TaxID=261450 RepID=A0A835HBR6_9MAGN|nr:hypothetical protein IFM89_010663 [Coptis chinensis]
MRADEAILQRLDASTRAPYWPVFVEGDRPPTKLPVPIPISRSTKNDETLMAIDDAKYFAMISDKLLLMLIFCYDRLLLMLGTTEIRKTPMIVSNPSLKSSRILTKPVEASGFGGDNEEVMKYEDMLELNLKLDLVAGGYSVVSVCWLVCVCGGDVRWCCWCSGVGGRWFSGVVFGVCGLVSAAASCMLLPPSWRSIFALLPSLVGVL